MPIAPFSASGVIEGMTERVSRIVVGVDGSDGSKVALRWALEEARLRGALVEAVYAWPFPHGVVGFGWTPTVDQESLDATRETAETLLDRTVTEVCRGRAGVEVVQHAIEGSPGEVLLERSLGAEMLVVGSRGFGGFMELLLGSVGHQCATHARCPVTIVRQVRPRTRALTDC